MKLEFQTQRGETVKFILFRAGDATLEVNQAGEWRAAFLSPQDVDNLRTFLASEPEPEFKFEPMRYLTDNYVMSFETAPMVPTVRRADAERG